MANYIAFIPVRGGSKSIPMKNVKKFNNKPLVYWVLKAATEVDLIDQIIVSTDSIEIKSVVETFNISKVNVIMRDSELSRDETSTEAVMLDFASKNLFKHIILLQATSPLTKSDDISNAISFYEKNKYDSVLSVVNTHRFIWEKSELLGVPINYDPNHRPRRQDWNGQYIENGAIYITSRLNLNNSKSRISGRIGLFEMSSKTYFEIDEPDDWMILENIHKSYQGEYDSIQFSKIKMVITDVDGVLTDGKMIYIGNDEGKSFHARDGMGFELLHNKGILTGIISGENSDLIIRRANKLKVNSVNIGIKNKLEVLNKISKEFKLDFDEIAYIGDDINDIDVLNSVGLPVSVADGNHIVRNCSKIVLSSSGGNGAFREFVDLLLEKKTV
jgi:YrbI family 3-deoxy-D-manno-octulosonate 8-phosphate phosphatase